jgi:hypothetical protein
MHPPDGLPFIFVGHQAKESHRTSSRSGLFDQAFASGSWPPITRSRVSPEHREARGSSRRANDGIRQLTAEQRQCAALLASTIRNGRSGFLRIGKIAEIETSVRQKMRSQVWQVASELAQAKSGWAPPRTPHAAGNFPANQLSGTSKRSGERADDMRAHKTDDTWNRMRPCGLPDL